MDQSTLNSYCSLKCGAMLCASPTPLHCPPASSTPPPLLYLPKDQSALDSSCSLKCGAMVAARLLTTRTMSGSKNSRLRLSGGMGVGRSQGEGGRR